jgi:hypothetical protein
MTTPAAPMPANYDSAVFNVDLAAFMVCIPAMTALIDDVADDVAAVVTAINNLTLGWAGDTAAEVTAFFDSWNTAVTALVGNGDPNATAAQSGTLDILAGALTAAMTNYDATETLLVQQFQQFTQALTAGAGAQNQPSANVSDQLISVVGETFSG